MAVISGENDSPKASVNWGAGIRGIAAAWILASTGLWSHSTLPLFAAALIVAFALLVPLRVGHLVFTREFGWFLLRTVLLVVAVTTVAFPASLAANSKQPTVAALGGVLFIGLLATSGALLLGVVKVVAMRSLPGLVPALKNVRAKAYGWVVQMTAAMRSV